MSLVDLLKKTTPKYQTTIPSSGKKIWFRPFIVREEKMLLMAQETGKENEIFKAIVSIINECFDDIGDASKLPIFDLEYLFIKLRAKSVMEVVNPILECPETKQNLKLNINLEDIEVKKFENHSTRIKISDDLVLQMKYPSISLFIEHEVENMQLMDFYDLAVSCIDYIETQDSRISADESSKQELREFVDNMTKVQFDELIKFFATMPKIEHEVKYKTNDGVERSVTIRGIKDFFG
jgi:hypothetical protein